VFDFSPVQIIIVLAIALLVFGAARLPAIGRDLGRGLREFRGALTGAPSAPAVPDAPAERDTVVRSEEPPGGTS
jgi:sec-independent protein translocase protein TatA